MPVCGDDAVDTLCEPPDRPPSDQGPDGPPRLAAMSKGVSDRRSPGRTMPTLDEPNRLRALRRSDAESLDVAALPRLNRKVSSGPAGQPTGRGGAKAAIPVK